LLLLFNFAHKKPDLTKSFSGHLNANGCSLVGRRDEPFQKWYALIDVVIAATGCQALSLIEAENGNMREMTL